MTVAAVVLAAGGGRRFEGGQRSEGGGHKLVAPFRGQPLVTWAVGAARSAGLDETIVVTGALDLQAVLPDDLTLLDNPSWAQGQATSLAVALDWCQRRDHQAAVVGLGDQPLIPATAWRAVANAPAAPIAVATYQGQRRNPVRLARSVWALMPTSGDQGARSIIRQRPDLVVEVACEGQPADVDTVEDLETWS